jgi:hypothetical protein
VIWIKSGLHSLRVAKLSPERYTELAHVTTSAPLSAFLSQYDQLLYSPEEPKEGNDEPRRDCNRGSAW